jgi:hypothetical protein
MKIASIIVHYLDWDNNEVEVEAYYKPIAAGGGRVNYRFYNVSWTILDSIIEWASYKSHPHRGKTGYIVPRNGGWEWYDGIPLVATSYTDEEIEEDVAEAIKMVRTAKRFERLTNPS